MRKLEVGAVQARFTDDMATDVAHVASLVEEAARRGARVVLPPELFQGHYFCRVEDERYFERAFPTEKHPAVKAMRELARRLEIVIPTSYFEKDGPHYYNSLALVDADGSLLGTYRKSHIPDGPGYEEKFYFRPGNTGFCVWDTRHGRIGVGVCWDQWFPEPARAMVLEGAEVLFYPSAIGSEPEDPELDTRRLWQRAMVGHAVSNLVPIVAANRIGTEDGQTYYGHSFITDHFGDVLAELSEGEEGVVVAELDLDEAARRRAAFGFFRDRRPELYGRIVRDE
ncbi:MAG TPA: N-carbamoylputrescine amidase [Longimicrobiales bacterium]|nr:N-carbamoylputrescine amidase [Longimicrobiales bacterium]